MEKKLPIFKALINEDLDSDVEINYVALVEYPAIEKNFMAFNKQMQFKITNEDRRIVSGALMLADTPIYRYSPDMGEYYIVFTKEEIYKMVRKYFNKGYQTNLNIEHNGQMIVNGAVLFESWIVDKERGIQPMKGFEDVNDGSWFGSYYINNDDVWNDIKAGTFKGFSIEGILSIEQVEEKEDKYQKMYDEIKKILDSIE